MQKRILGSDIPMECVTLLGQCVGPPDNTCDLRLAHATSRGQSCAQVFSRPDATPISNGRRRPKASLLRRPESHFRPTQGHLPLLGTRPFLIRRFQPHQLACAHVRFFIVLISLLRVSFRWCQMSRPDSMCRPSTRTLLLSAARTYIPRLRGTSGGLQQSRRGSTSRRQSTAP